MAHRITLRAAVAVLVLQVLLEYRVKPEKAAMELHRQLLTHLLLTQAAAVGAVALHMATGVEQAAREAEALGQQQ
jgi:hypothetical protein